MTTFGKRGDEAAGDRRDEMKAPIAGTELPELSEARGGDWFGVEESRESGSVYRLVHRFPTSVLDASAEGEIVAGVVSPGADPILLPILAPSPEIESGQCTVTYRASQGWAWSPAGDAKPGSWEETTEGFLSFLRTLTLELVQLHNRGRFHYNLRPGSLVIPREGAQTLGDLRLLDTGVRFLPSSLPIEDLAYYENRGRPGSRFAVYSNYDSYDRAADLVSLGRLGVWLVDRVRWGEAEIEGMLARVESEALLEEDARAVAHAIELNREDLFGAVREVCRRVGGGASIDLVATLDEFLNLWKRTEEEVTRGGLAADFVRAQLRSRDGERRYERCFSTREVPQVRGVIPAWIERACEPSRVRIVGTGLHSDSIFYLRRIEESRLDTGEEDDFFAGSEIPSGPAAAGCTSAREAVARGLPLLCCDEKLSDGPTCLYRVIPPLSPGAYRLFSTTEGDTGHLIEVADDSGLSRQPRIDSVEPQVIAEAGRETQLTIRGENLHRLGVLHLERDGEWVRSQDGFRYSRLRRIEEGNDESHEVQRVVPALGRPGSYRLRHDGQPTGIGFEVEAGAAVFSSVEPERVGHEESFRIRVTGRLLPVSGRVELRDSWGHPALGHDGVPVVLEPAAGASSPESVEVSCPRALRPGIYGLHFDGVESGLEVTVASPVDSLSPRRLHTHGKIPPLRLQGGFFSLTSTYGLRGAKKLQEVQFVDLSADGEGVELLLPKETPPDRYEVVIDGVETGREVKVARFSRSTNSIAAVVMLLILSLGGLAGVPYVFRSEFAEVSPALLHFLPGDGRILEAESVELYGRHLQEKRNYVLVPMDGDGEEDRISLQAAKLDRGGARLSFHPLVKVPAVEGKGFTPREFEICLADDGGEIDERTGVLISMVPFSLRVEELEGEGVIFDGESYSRKPSAEASRELWLTLSGLGLDALEDGELELEPGDSDLEVREREDGRTAIALLAPDRLKDSVDYRISFRAERAGIELGSVRLEEFVGFEGISTREDGEDKALLDLFNENGQALFVRTPSAAKKNGPPVSFRLTAGPSRSALTPALTAEAVRESFFRLELPLVPGVGESVVADLEFRSAPESSWRGTGMAVRLIPVPTWSGFPVGGSGTLSVEGRVGLSNDPEGASLRCYGRNLEEVETVRLGLREPSPGSPPGVPVSVKTGRDERGEYWDLSFERGNLEFGTDYGLSYRSPVSGEKVPVPLGVRFFDRDGAQRVARNVDWLNRAWSEGELERVREISVSLLDDRLESDWEGAVYSGAVSKNERDQVRVRQVFCDWFYRGRRGDVLEESGEWENDPARELVGALQETERKAVFDPRTGAGNSAIDPENREWETALAWVPHVVDAYASYLDVVSNRRFDRFEDAQSRMKEVEDEFPLAPLFLWDLRLYRAADRSGPGVTASIEALLEELDGLEIRGDESLVTPFRLYFESRGRLWLAVRGGGRRDRRSQDLLEAIRELEMRHPSLCASLIAQARSVDAFSLSDREDSELDDVWTRVLPQLDPGSATAMALWLEDR